jgi:hypothetical protein
MSAFLVRDLLDMPLSEMTKQVGGALSCLSFVSAVVGGLTVELGRAVCSLVETVGSHLIKRGRIESATDLAS